MFIKKYFFISLGILMICLSGCAVMQARSQMNKDGNMINVPNQEMIQAMTECLKNNIKIKTSASCVGSALLTLSNIKYPENLLELKVVIRNYLDQLYVVLLEWDGNKIDNVQMNSRMQSLGDDFKIKVKQAETNAVNGYAAKYNLQPLPRP